MFDLLMVLFVTSLTVLIGDLCPEGNRFEEGAFEGRLQQQQMGANPVEAIASGR